MELNASYNILRGKIAINFFIFRRKQLSYKKIYIYVYVNFVYNAYILYERDSYHQDQAKKKKNISDAKTRIFFSLAILVIPQLLFTGQTAIKNSEREAKKKNKRKSESRN